MHEIDIDGVTYRYHDASDLAECRVCHVAPEVKRSASNGAIHVVCPSCGIRTGASTNENAAMDVWNAVMGGEVLS
jgi:hypothetical protein